MASRAFFRCRACGEPVVAGAYRCPVCAIDFPAGTPGAPTASGSSAAVDPLRPDRRADEPRLASNVPADVRADVIAARLDQALVDEMSPASIPESVPAVIVLPAVPEPSVGADVRDDAGLLNTVPGARETTSEVQLTVAPERNVVATRQGADLAVAPERSSPLGSSDFLIAPARLGEDRERPVPSWERAIEAAPPRRNKLRALAVTLVVALVALGGVGAAGYFLQSSSFLALGGAGTGASEPLRIGEADGWVDVPGQDGTMVITADGPYRIRLNGAVYTMTGSETLNVPMTETTALAIRAIGELTVARVARAQ